MSVLCDCSGKAVVYDVEEFMSIIRGSGIAHDVKPLVVTCATIFEDFRYYSPEYQLFSANSGGIQTTSGEVCSVSSGF